MFTAIKKMKRITAHDVGLLLLVSHLIIIIMYISHALINTLSAHMIHIIINLNTIILLIILTIINSHMYVFVCIIVRMQTL